MLKRSERLLTFAFAAYLVAGVTVVASVIAAVILIRHQPACSRAGTCDVTDHPLVGVGVAVLAAGLVVGFAWFVIGQLCATTSELAAAAALAERQSR